MEAVDSIRGRLDGVEHFVALGSAAGRKGWTEYEASIATAGPDFKRPDIAEGDLLSLNYTSGTTAKPKGVMITHRNAWMNIVGTLVHLHLGVDDRYLWTLPMFHANGWTFVWIVTAVGGTHVCLRKVESRTIFTLIRDEGITLLCAAPTILISIANAPEEVRRILLPAEDGSTLPTKAAERRNVRVLTAGAPLAAATIERIEGELGW